MAARPTPELLTEGRPMPAFPTRELLTPEHPMPEVARDRRIRALIRLQAPRRFRRRLGPAGAPQAERRRSAASCCSPARCDSCGDAVFNRVVATTA